MRSKKHQMVGKLGDSHLPGSPSTPSPALCLPNATTGAQLCQKDPLHLPGDLLLLVNTTLHQDVPKCPQLGDIPPETWQPSIRPIVHSLSILNTSVRHLWCDLIQMCPLTGPVSSELFSPA